MPSASLLDYRRCFLKRHYGQRDGHADITALAQSCVTDAVVYLVPSTVPALKLCWLRQAKAVGNESGFPIRSLKGVVFHGKAVKSSPESLS